MLKRSFLLPGSVTKDSCEPQAVTERERPLAQTAHELLSPKASGRLNHGFAGKYLVILLLHITVEQR